MRELKASAILITIFVSVSAFGLGSKDLALELRQVSNARDMFTNSLKQKVAAYQKKKQLSPSKLKQFKTAIESIRKNKEFNEILVEVTRKLYTDDEMEKLITYYRNPPNKKLEKELGHILKMSPQKLKSAYAPHMKDISRIAKEAFAKHFTKK